MIDEFCWAYGFLEVTIASYLDVLKGQAVDQEDAEEEVPVKETFFLLV